MPAIITLLYPAVEFDMDYYLKNHMTAVTKAWTSTGLKSWKVVKVSDPKSEHGVMCVMEWESVESFTKSTQDPDGVKIFADIPNYTKGTPVAVVGEVVGSG